MSTEEIEVKARDMGWSPKEEFKGDPEKWIDAETFVKRGEEFLPIVRAENKRLKQQSEANRSKIGQLESALKETRDTVEALKAFNDAIAKTNAKAREAEVKAKLVKAKEDDDHEAEVELELELREAREAVRETEKAPAKKVEAAPQQLDFTEDPEWGKWKEANPWFGTDKRRTMLALAIADELKSENPELKGREFLDAVAEELDNSFAAMGKPSRRTQKVEGDTRGSDAGNGRKRSYADLPPDAKAACDQDAKRLVGAGPNKAFKTEKEWRDYYVARYFEE